MRRLSPTELDTLRRSAGRPNERQRVEGLLKNMQSGATRYEREIARMEALVTEQRDSLAALHANIANLENVLASAVQA